MNQGLGPQQRRHRSSYFTISRFRLRAAEAGALQAASPPPVLRRPGVTRGRRRQGASVDARCFHFRQTPLIVAAMRGHTASVLALAARGAALDAKDAGGMTALQFAEERAEEESTSPPAFPHPPY